MASTPLHTLSLPLYSLNSPLHVLNKLYSALYPSCGWSLGEGCVSMGRQKHPLLPHQTPRFNKHIPGFPFFFIKHKSLLGHFLVSCPNLLSSREGPVWPRPWSNATVVLNLIRTKPRTVSQSLAFPCLLVGLPTCSVHFPGICSHWRPRWREEAAAFSVISSKQNRFPS